MALSAFVFSPSHAQEISYDGSPVKVNIARGRTTQVVLPARILNMVTAMDQTQISIEVFQNMLYLQPLYAPQGNIFVNTADGTGYGLLVETVEEDIADGTITIAAPSRKTDTAGKADNTIVWHMRQLITGAANRTAGSSDAGRVIYEDESIKIRLDRVYNWPHYTGWLCTAENVSGGTVVVPVQQVSMPRLRAISTDTETLEPKQATRVYILLGK